MPASEPPVLSVAELQVDYREAEGHSVRVLAGVELALKPGEALGVLGESGCGKTTLARAILGILPPAARVVGGSIRLAGRELLGLPEAELERIRGRSIAMIFQEPGLALSPVLRVGVQIGDVLRCQPGHRQAAPSERQRTVEELLARVRLPDPARIHDAYPHQLSGGQLQRVVLARAIAGGPRVLLADEPTSAVDATVQREILSILTGLRRELGLALLFISHDPALLAQVCDRILVMYAGTVAEMGDRDEILSRPLHPYTRALLACAPRRGHQGSHRLATISGPPPDPARPPSGCRFEPRCGERLAACCECEPLPTTPELDRQVRCFLYGGC